MIVATGAGLMRSAYSTSQFPHPCSVLHFGVVRVCKDRVLELFLIGMVSVVGTVSCTRLQVQPLTCIARS